MSGDRNISHSEPPESRTPDAAARVFGVVRALHDELHPRKPLTRVIAATDLLERDLGIDSLARVELLLRLEQALGVHVSGDRLMQADTVEDLLQLAVAGGINMAAPDTAAAAPVAPGTAMLPDDARSIVDAFEFHALAVPDRPHLHLLEGDDSLTTVSYGELWSHAQGVAGKLRDCLLGHGERVAVMVPTSLGFFATFLGIQLAGGVPVPIYPPLRRSQFEEHLLRQAAILRNAEAVALIVADEAGFAGRVIRSQVESIRHVLTVRELMAAAVEQIRVTAKPDDTAMLQYTSGSTGDPKGVVLSHANLLANVRALGRAFAITPEDVVVSWLPLYHDMGLIGAWMGSLYHACPLVVMSPLSFLARPERWLKAIHRFHGTLSAAPNFAFELCLGKIRDQDLAGIDLSSWRVAGNGAEAVRAETIERFTARFAPYGFNPSAMTPMYGLAENAVALTVALPPERPYIDAIDRAILMRDGQARPAGATASALRLCACGPPISGHEVRIVDRAGHELADREEGEIEFRGPSATAGYFRNPEKTASLLDGSWRRTGDLGYIAAGNLFVTGRLKDIIIRAGRNLYPDELESAVGDVEGIRKGRVAVFASTDPAGGTERLVVVAETRESDPAVHAHQRDAIRGVLVDRIDLPPDDIVLAPPGTVLKTANGKVRRAACQQLYSAGRLHRAPPQLWQQIIGLSSASIGPQARRLRRAIGSFMFACWYQFLYRLIGLYLWPLVIWLPGEERRRGVLRQAARFFLWATRLTPQVQGLENLPRERHHIIVSNHASYLDGLVLSAVLPARYAFVAKQELSKERIAGPFLWALGTVFMERFDLARRIEDQRRLSVILAQGQSLVTFPEGTFDRRPGLRLFALGPFAAATEAVVPVVPVVLRGTRGVLREDSTYAHHGTIEVTIGAPVMPEGPELRQVAVLRDRVRQTILETCREPDLIGEITAIRLRASAARPRHDGSTDLDGPG